MSVKTTVLEEGARGPVTMEVDEQGGALRVHIEPPPPGVDVRRERFFIVKLARQLTTSQAMQTSPLLQATAVVSPCVNHGRV